MKVKTSCKASVSFKCPTRPLVSNQSKRINFSQSNLFIILNQSKFKDFHWRVKPRGCTAPLRSREPTQPRSNHLLLVQKRRPHENGRKKRKALLKLCEFEVSVLTDFAAVTSNREPSRFAKVYRVYRNNLS